MICNRPGTFKPRWDIVAKMGPVGASLILDVMLSTNAGSTFTSLWASNPGNRPTIAGGGVSATGTSFDTTAFLAGYLLRLDVIQVGSSTPGQNVSLAVLGATDLITGLDWRYEPSRQHGRGDQCQDDQLFPPRDLRNSP